MKRLLNILSANRKFITAFVGLYAAYTLGFTQGTDHVKNNPAQFSLVAGQKEIANVLGATGDNSSINGNIEIQPNSANGPENADRTSAASSANSENKETSKGSTTVSGSQGGTAAASASASPAAKNLPTSPAPSSSTIVSKKIDASGKYTYMGQNINYDLSFKNTGGNVTGVVGGACTGTVDGNFDGKDGGVVSGSVKGSCGVGFISKKLDATYTGNVYLNRGIVNITLHGDIPFVEGDQSFSLSFTP